VVYLGGTVHVLRPSDYPLPAEFDAAYTDSDKVILETDIAQLKEPAVREMMRDGLRYEDGRTLARVLSPDAYRVLEERSEASGVSLSRLQTFRPIVVLLGLVAAELERLGISDEGVDEYFHAQAIADGKPVASLETVESQMEVLRGMGEGQESEFVMHAVEELKVMQAMFEETVGAWRVGDVARLAGLLLQETEREYPALYHALIVRRNRDWLPKLEKLFTEPGIEFVLVGVAHLVGEDGLLRELEYTGYEVRQLADGGVGWRG